jgi:glycogen phosphorylase
MDLKNTKTAYFSMEYAIHQSLKIYSGGLGFLSGSHMRSARDLAQDITGIGILYTNGYYDQERNTEGYMEVKFIKKRYAFLKDTGIIFTITVHGAPVHVKAYYLAPEIFDTAPIYLLTTDIPENDFLSRSISFRLYDSNEATKIAQFMLLGIGGAKLLEILKIEPDIYHMNEGHALPLLFYLYSKSNDINKVKERVVFTTHTPEKAGNEEISIKLLNQMSFFSGIAEEEIKRIAYIKENTLNFTLTALRMSKIANGVSKIHGAVANTMWGGNEGICKIISITNGQNKKFWMDAELENFLMSNDDEGLEKRKKQLKKEMLEIVANQTGKMMKEDILTIVWARRFTSYKRADLIIKDFDRFLKLVSRTENPVQVIWAGKPYPEDYGAIDLFNKLIRITNDLSGCAVLTGYEMKLSSILKKGADVWLNTPRFTREASGTSGMTAAMNGTVNFSIPDGWVPEFALHGKNSFVIPVNPTASYDKQDVEDYSNMMNILENEIIPVYYYQKNKWTDIIKSGARDIIPAFDSDRMAKEYSEKLYNYL